MKLSQDSAEDPPEEEADARMAVDSSSNHARPASEDHLPGLQNLKLLGRVGVAKETHSSSEILSLYG